MMKFSTLYSYRGYRFVPEMTGISFYDIDGERVANWYVEIEDIPSGKWYFRCLFSNIRCEDMPIDVLYEWEQIVTVNLKCHQRGWI